MLHRAEARAWQCRLCTVLSAGYQNKSGIFDGAQAPPAAPPHARSLGLMNQLNSPCMHIHICKRGIPHARPPKEKPFHAAHGPQ